MQFLSLVFKDSKFSVYIRDDADESVMAEIFKHHEYRAVENIIKETAETIVDVGAHAGFFILYARVLNKKAPILAIEPEKENLSVLNRHIKENKICQNCNKNFIIVVSILFLRFGLEFQETSYCHIKLFILVLVTNYGRFSN